MAFPLVLPMLSMLLTCCRPCTRLLLGPQKPAILGIVASSVQIAPWVTSEAPIKIDVILRLAVFIIVVHGDRHYKPFGCLARVVYAERCGNNLDFWCFVQGSGVHGVSACTSIHGAFLSSVD